MLYLDNATAAGPDDVGEMLILSQRISQTVEALVDRKGRPCAGRKLRGRSRRRGLEVAAPDRLAILNAGPGGSFASSHRSDRRAGSGADAREGRGEIDWNRRVLIGHGQGAPDLNAPSVAVARLGAERAAKLDAYRNALESLKGCSCSPAAASDAAAGRRKADRPGGGDAERREADQTATSRTAA